MAATKAVAAASVAPPKPAELLNLLIVEDERATREACEAVAEAVGFRVHVADGAVSAYEMLEQQAIDVVLLALRSPDGGGLEVLEEIKQRRPQAEVILMTSFGTVQSAVQAMRFGAYDYLSKPFEGDALRLLLDRVKLHVRILTE